MSKTQQFHPLSPRMLLLAGLALTLSGCGITGSDTIDLQKSGNVHDAIEAATGPLQDLNLRRQEIPPLLVQAAVNPYGHQPKVLCTDIKTEVAELDTLLGPDIEPTSLSQAMGTTGPVDNIKSVADMEIPDTMTIVDTAYDTAGSFAHDALMGTIRSHTNILPFRGILRKITGAEKHAKKLEAAYQAGKLRRAYLKGLAEVNFGEKCLAKPVTVEAKADIGASKP